MTVELMLLRHGQAEESKGRSDRDRALTTKGKRQAQRIGAWLLDQGLMPDLVISSPAKRAFDTAEKALKAAGHSIEMIRTDDRLYPGSKETALAVLADHRNCQRRILLVGHNPWAEELVRHVVDQPDETVMKTGAMVRLSVPDWPGALYRGGARLAAHIVPKALPKVFPFDGPDGPEYRDRPAYYYSQSAALPYRWSEGELEILLLGSGEKKKRGLPKGIHDLGLTAQESAAREAEEEAGVLGEIHQDSVGSYEIEKWGAICTVRVYPLAVAEVLADKDWEENHRKRQWVRADKAVGMVKGAALRKIVSDFVDSFPAN